MTLTMIEVPIWIKGLTGAIYVVHDDNGATFPSKVYCLLLLFFYIEDIFKRERDGLQDKVKLPLGTILSHIYFISVK